MILKFQTTKSGRPQYTLERDGWVIGTFTWTEWCGQEPGFRYFPQTAARRVTRVLRPTIREALMKSAKIKAADADRMIANVKETT